MKQDYRQLMRPEVINSISGLALIAKVIVEGYLAGAHSSRRNGPGLEFSQYRGYQPGDDMRLLDWKMLARSGRYYIKESDIDTHVSVKFIVDASLSMLHEENGLIKMDYVRVLVASLSYLSNIQGDAVGLFALNNKKLQYLHPTMTKQHYKRLLHQLVTLDVAGEWPENRDDLDKVRQRNRKELLFFITDLYENDSELTRWIQDLKTVRNEVVVLHIMGKNELEFNYKGDVAFEDLETGKRVKVNAQNTKEYYLNALESDIISTKNKLLNKGIGYELFRFDSPLEEALQLFLKNRNRIN